MDSESLSDGPPKYFGWIVESQTHPEAGRIDIGMRGEPLAPEVVREFEEIVGLFGRIRPTVIDFLTLREDYRALLGLPDELHAYFGSQRLPILDAGLRNIEAHVAAERRLSAFLNSASSFRDRLLARLTDPDALSRLKSLIAAAYDEAFGYRLGYNLRNFSQHHSNPLNIIPVQANAKEDGALAYTVELELERDRLVDADSKFQPKVKAELRGMPEKVPLIPNCVEYYKGLRRVFVGYLALNGSDIHVAIGYEEAVRDTIPEMPAGATPLLFHGKPSPGEGQFNCKTTSFSFDELDLLKRILAETAVEDGIAP